MNMKKHINLFGVPTPAPFTIADERGAHSMRTPGGQQVEQLRDRAEEQRRQAEEIALRITALVTYHNLMRAVRPE